MLPNCSSLYALTLCMLMDFLIQIKAKRMGLSIIYFKGSQVVIYQLWCISIHKDVFTLTNILDPGEMMHHAAFHLGLHCLSKYPFKGFQYENG